MKTKIVIFLVLMIFFSANFMMIGNANIINSKMDNNPPNPPEIDGPVMGKIKETYNYNITVTDPDEDDYLLKLEVDFGDGIVQEDCGCGRPWENGKTIEMWHSWKKEGRYEIKARVADVNNYWSNWSEPYVINMPKTKSVNNYIFQYILKNLPNVYNTIRNT